MRWILLLLLLTHNLIAQNQENKASEPLVFYFRNGKVSGYWRTYAMFTDNQKGLMDWGAVATGLLFQYQTLPLHKIHLSTGFAAVGNVWQYHLTEKDPTTLQPSRYEIGLYDVTQPSRYEAIFLLTHLAIHYHLKQWSWTLGKQLIKTPFINPQDGRMIPTLVEGLYGQKTGKWQLKLGYFYRMAPRGVSRWYTVAQSIGVYPQGLQPNGNPSQYAGNTHTNGIAMLDLERTFSNRFNLKAHNLFIDNIMNTALLQAEFFIKDSLHHTRWAVEGQVIRQDGIGNGGNPDPAKRYFPKNSKSLTFGARLMWGHPKASISLNFNRITAWGRYLIPREWGIEPFFTFLPRERSDGFADVYAYALKTAFTPTHYLHLAYQSAIVTLPDVKNYAFNKYGMPSYWQHNLEIRLHPQKFLKSLEILALIVYKQNLGETYQTPKFIINRTNMFLWNLIANYRF